MKRTFRQFKDRKNTGFRLNFGSGHKCSSFFVQLEAAMKLGVCLVAEVEQLKQTELDFFKDKVFDQAERVIFEPRSGKHLDFYGCGTALMAGIDLVENAKKNGCLPCKELQKLS